MHLHLHLHFVLCRSSVQIIAPAPLSEAGFSTLKILCNRQFLCFQISAKLGTGVHDVLKAIVERIPPPPVNREAPFRALLFDSWHDRYRGAIALVYVKDGIVKVGDEITSAHTKKNYEVRSLGLLRPHEELSKHL